MTKTKTEPIQHILRSCTKDVTPVRLKLLLVVNCLWVILFGWLVIATVKQHEHVVKTLGVEAVPSVIAAQQIKIAVEQLDTDLVYQLLSKSGERGASLLAEDFKKWQSIVAKELVIAAKNITYGPTEQIPIENVQIGLGQYEMQAQQALDMHALGKNVMTVDCYLNALKTLENQLLPNAEALHRANSDNLEASYAKEESEAALLCGFVTATGMILIVFLLATQVYLARRFRRRLNLPLLIATLSLIFFVSKLYLSLMHNGSHLRIAKEDAYNSIIVLLKMRANSYQANAAMGRWLLDKSHAREHENAFADKANSIVNFAPGHNFAEIINRAEKQLAVGEKFNLPGFSGLLADEFNNVRFAGEGQTAIEALQAFSEFVTAEANVLNQEKIGLHDKALTLALSYDTHAAGFSFSKFDDSIERLLKINQHHFDHSIKAAAHDLKRLTITSQLICLLVLFCIYTGLRPRLAEYLRPS